ncbi:MAG: Trm112 family protein, partial [bacterium]|nr:Trm112 family protein [bacterium]
ELLDILACPICKKGVALTKYEEEKNGLKCDDCKKIYPLIDGSPVSIPVMLVDEAIAVE